MRTIRPSKASPLAGGEWWNVFNDPTLASLVHLAYEQNPNIRVASSNVLQARAGQAISVGNLLPQSQQATASYTRAALNTNMPIINQLAKTLPPGSTAFSNWFYGFNLSWELDLWGRLCRASVSLRLGELRWAGRHEHQDDAVVRVVGPPQGPPEGIRLHG
jgi:outer membrane protein TolC